MQNTNGQVPSNANKIFQDICPANNYKNVNYCWHFRIISRIGFTSSSAMQIKILNCCDFNIYKYHKFPAWMRYAQKEFYNLKGPVLKGTCARFDSFFPPTAVNQLTDSKHPKQQTSADIYPRLLQHMFVVRQIFMQNISWKCQSITSGECIHPHFNKERQLRLIGRFYFSWGSNFYLLEQLLRGE